MKWYRNKYLKWYIKIYVKGYKKCPINDSVKHICVTLLTEVAFILRKVVASAIVACKMLTHIFKVSPSSIPCRFTCGKFWNMLSFSTSGPKGVNPSLSGGPIHAQSTSILIPNDIAPLCANFLDIFCRTYKL